MFYLPAYNEVSVTCTTAKGCGTWLTNDTSCTRDTCTSGTSVSAQKQWKTLTTTIKSSCSYCWPGIVVVVCSERSQTRQRDGKKEGELGRETRLSALPSLTSFFSRSRVCERFNPGTHRILCRGAIGFNWTRLLCRTKNINLHDTCWMVNHSSLTKTISET